MDDRHAMQTTFIRPLISIALVLLFSWTGTAQERLKCVTFTFRVPLSAGQSYKKQIGGNLTLKVRADNSQKEPNGWDFMLEDDLFGNDYIAPVNPPLRFNPSQILGPGYNLTASQSLQINRELRFILTRSDYELVQPLWEGALWPYSAPDPEKAAGNYLDAISRITSGILNVKTIDFLISADDKIRSLVLEFRLTVPKDFPVDPAFETKSVDCPAKF